LIDERVFDFVHELEPFDFEEVVIIKYDFVLLFIIVQVA